MIQFSLSFIIVKHLYIITVPITFLRCRVAGRAGLASSPRSRGTVPPALPPAQAQTSGGRHPPLHCFLPAIPALPACVLLGSVPRETLLLQPLHMQLLSCFLCVPLCGAAARFVVVAASRHVFGGMVLPPSVCHTKMP